MRNKVFLRLLVLLCFTQTCTAAVIISAGRKGASTSVGSNSTLTWDLTWQGSQSYLFDGLEFAVRLDRRIDRNSVLTVTLFRGNGGNRPENSVATIGGIPATATISASMMDDLRGPSFKDVRLDLPSAGTLPAGDYSISLSSNSVSEGFYVKRGPLTLYQVNPDGTRVELDPTEFVDTSPIPEPGGIVMFAISGLFLTALRARRRRPSHPIGFRMQEPA